MISKSLKVVAAAAVGAAMVLSLTGTAFALTASDISMLQAAGIISSTQAASLLASLGGSTVSTGFVFSKNLTVGMTNADVKALQQVLGVTPQSGYFGPITLAAVKAYQTAHNISPAAGFVGPITRASLNGSSPVIPGVPSTGGLSVALTSSMVNTAGAVINGQAAADLLEVRFTNASAVPAVVTNVTLKRSGISADENLDAVYLYQGAVRLTDSASVSQGNVSFNAGLGLFTIPANSSVVITVKGDINSNTNTTPAGSIIVVSLTSATANGGVIAGSYPVMGASKTVANAALSAVVLSQSSLTSSIGNIQAGSINQTILGINIDSLSRAVWLKSLAVKVIGSAPAGAIQNYRLYVGGVQVASAVGADVNNVVTFDLTSNPYKIDSSRLIEVRADVVSGSSRTFTVSLQNASDIQLIDNSYNVVVTPSVTVPLTSGEWTINASTGGQVIVDRSVDSPSDNIISGASNTTLAKFTLKAYGENVKVNSLYASTSHDLQNVSLFANGLQIGSTANVTAAAGKIYTLGSSLILTAGQTVTLEIKGDIKNIDGTNATGTVKVTLNTPVTKNAQGTESFQTSFVPTAPKEGYDLTIVSGSLSASQNNAGFTTSIAPNSLVKLGSYTLNTVTAEDIRISGLSVGVGGDLAAFTNNVATNISNLYVAVNGQTVSNTLGQVSATNNPSLLSQVIVPSGHSIVVDVYGNVGSLTTGSGTTTISVVGYGVNSNTTANATTTGQTITVGSGSILTSAVTKVTTDAYSAQQYVVGGTSANIVRYNFVSTSGTTVLKELSFQGTGIDRINSITLPYSNTTIPVNLSVTSGATTTITGLNISVPTGAGQDIAVNVTYSAISDTSTNNSGDTANVTLTGYKYASAGTTVSTTTSNASADMKLVGGKPSVSLTSSGDAGVGYKIIAKVTISAVSGPIRLSQLPITVTTSGDAYLSSAIDVVNANTGLTATSSTQTSVATSTSNAARTFTFDSGIIPAGGSVTYDLKATVADTAVNGNGGTISTSLSSTKSLFKWIDVNGENVENTGAYIFLYPTNSATVSI